MPYNFLGVRLEPHLRATFSAATGNLRQGERLTQRNTSWDYGHCFLTSVDVGRMKKGNLVVASLHSSPEGYKREWAWIWS